MKMKIYNAFGITPTNSYVSAGSDYYVPNIKSDEQKEKALKAFEKSYGKTTEEINRIISLFETLEVTELKNNTINLVHLYLALYDVELEEIKNINLAKSVLFFLDNFVVYDKIKDVVGIRVELNDTLFINSGIKVALDTVLQGQGTEEVDILRSLGIGVAGLYVNKSGKGNAGWDVRACLVDEDYAGFVHLSQSYTKELIEDGQNIVYCGDKLTQMMLVPVFHTQYEEVNENEYENIMSNSSRGEGGFGSTDVKH